MKFDNILKYQRADIEYMKLRKEINSNVNFQKRDDAARAFEEAKQANADNVSQAQYMLENFEVLEESIKQLEEEITSLCNRLDGDNLNVEEEVAITNQLDSLQTKLNNLTKESSRLKVLGEKSIKGCEEAQRKGVEARNAYNIAKKACEDLKQEKGVELDKKDKERKELREKVEKEWLEKYDKLMESGVRPPFVAVAGTENEPSCGCGMTFSDALKTELKENGYVECESCHRIAYVKENKNAKSK